MVRNGVNQEGYERDIHLMAMFAEENGFACIAEMVEAIESTAEDYGTDYDTVREDLISERTVDDDERSTGTKTYPWDTI
jgi:hypothetical protein